MTYAETLSFLYNSTPVFEHIGASAYKPGLATTLSLAEHFGNPHRQFAAVHVAGTNGKGSVSHSIAATLQTAGYKVGLYTSPHLVDFRERMRVNGEQVSENFVINFVEDFRKWNEGNTEKMFPSFFELTTIMAFKYFAEQKVDVAVVEVGLGGRLDSTNIITPVLSVITNISYDHQQFLGNTLAEIASEKAGIIKSDVPVVIGERTAETAEVFRNKAQALSSPLYFADEFTSNAECVFELKGSYQTKNLQTILCALHHLAKHFSISEEAKLYALSHVTELTCLQGRWQKLQEKPVVICDTGHNVAAWEYLSSQIASQECDTLRIVFGMVDDKDIDSVLTLLKHTSATAKAKHVAFYFTQASTHRAIAAETVRQKALEHNIEGQCFTTVAEAYSKALDDSSPADFVFAGGSSYVVADLLSFVKSKQG